MKLSPFEESLQRDLTLHRQRLQDEIKALDAVLRTLLPDELPAPKPRRPARTKRVVTQKARLKVLSTTHPTPEELEDREVAYTTEEPAGDVGR